MPILYDNKDQRGSGAGPGKGSRQPSFFGKAWRGTKWLVAVPFQAFPREEIGKTGRLIGELWGVVRGGRKRDGRFRVNQDWSFDLRATAFLHGISVLELEALMARRRRATARAAYLSFGLGWLFFLAWLWRAATMPWNSAHVLPMLEFAPFCLVFFLAAFFNALQNYQIRTRRLATAGEYLATSGSFWPS